MTTKQQITIDVGEGLLLDVNEAMRSRVLVAGNAGAGKSHAFRRIAEQLFPHLPVFVFDRTGEFVTLREHFDVVVIGDDGDAPCNVENAGELALRLFAARTSVVFDLSGLRVSAKRQFVRDVLTAIAELPRTQWSPVMMLIDEAHHYAEEGAADVDGSGAAMLRVLSECRKQGLGVVLATQRLTKLNKSVAAECNTMCFGRCVLDLDVVRMGKALGLDRKDRRLMGLQPGQFFASGPGFPPPLPRLFMFGSVKTTHPGPDDLVTGIKPAAPSRALREILAKLALANVTPAPAIAERPRIGAGSARAVGPAPDIPKELVELRRRCDEQGAALAQARERAEQHGREQFELGRLDGLAAAARAVAALQVTVGEVQRDDMPRPMAVADVAPKPVRRAPTAATPKAASTKRGNGGERRMLVALAQHGRLTRGALAMFSDLAVTGGSFSTYLSRLSVRGWITAEGDKVEITQVGRHELGPYERLPTGRALLDHWLDWAGGAGARRMLEAIFAAGATGTTRSEIARQSGVVESGGSFGTYLSRFKRAGLIVVNGQRVTMSAALVKAMGSR